MAAVERKRIVFLCSGGGGNLAFVHHATEQGWVDGAIVAVLTDRQCHANVFAESVGIANHCIDFNGPSQTELLEALEKHKPDVVVTTVHKILCDEVVEAYRGKLVNLHYSLLPAFGGLIGDRPVRAAIEYGARFTGATVHLVDETVDGGRPLVQVAIPLRAEENDFTHLMDLVFRCGCISLMWSIDILLNGGVARNEATRLKMMGRECLASGHVGVVAVVDDERFWQQVMAQTLART